MFTSISEISLQIAGAGAILPGSLAGAIENCSSSVGMRPGRRGATGFENLRHRLRWGRAPLFGIRLQHGTHARGQTAARGVPRRLLSLRPQRIAVGRTQQLRARDARSSSPRSRCGPDRGRSPAQGDWNAAADRPARAVTSMKRHTEGEELIVSVSLAARLADSTHALLRRVAGELGAVVGRFLRDGNVMGVALPHAGRRDLDEPRFRPQLLDRSWFRNNPCRPASRRQADRRTAERPLERHAAFDSFGHQLAGSPLVAAPGGIVRSSLSPSPPANPCRDRP